MRLDDEIYELAASHHSCVATWQLRDLGLRKQEIHRMKQSSRWDVLGNRVLVLNGSGRSAEQRACAAVLEAGRGAALASYSASAWWGLGSRYRLLPACVMANRPAASIRGEIGHIYPRIGIPNHWITEYDGIAVVRPELCIYQMCGLVHPLAAERILDNGLSLGLVTTDSERRCLNDLAKQGRNGTVLLRTLLDARPPGYVPVASGLEARFNQVMDGDARLWRRQVDSGGEMWAGRVDFRHVIHPVIAEVQSRRYHDALSFRRDDKTRRERLEAAGFTVVEVWDDEVWHDPEKVRTVVRSAVIRVAEGVLAVNGQRMR